MSDKVQIGARVPDTLYRQLRVLAATRDTTVGELVEEAITDLLRKYRRAKHG